MLVCVAFFVFVAQAQAAPVLDVSPAIIDESGHVRAISKHTVTITNISNQKVQVYPFINNILEEEGKQEFATYSEVDRSRSLANWLTFSRAVVDLEPGQSHELPITLDIFQFAVPDIYHAALSFGYGSSRDSAEKRASENPTVLINVEVLDNAQEVLEFRRFTSTKKITIKPPLDFVIDVYNAGNRQLTPTGTLSLISGNGSELVAVPVNEASLSIEPESPASFSVTVPEFDRVGRYKAFVELEYANGKRIQDTTFFWLLPIGKIILIIAALIVVIIFFAFMRGGNKRDDEYYYEDDDYYDDEYDE